MNTYRIDFDMQPAIDLDLANECEWEEIIECLSLEEAGLEESGTQPMFGLINRESTTVGGLYDYVNWFYDREYNDCDAGLHMT